METINGYKFNGKIYGRENNYYIFSNNEKVMVSNNDAKVYWDNLTNSLKNEFNANYLHRREHYESDGCKLSIYYKDGEIESLSINGKTIVSNKSNSDAIIKNLPLYKEKFNCVLYSTISGSVELQNGQYIRR